MTAEDVKGVERSHMDRMEQFNFDGPAELYSAVGKGFSRRSMSFKRFASSAEAIQYAVEVVGSEKLWGTVIETETQRLEAAQIRALYQHADYPLRRLAPKSAS